MHPKVRFANHAALMSSVPLPLYQSTPTAWPLSRCPIGVAVPTAHSFAGRFNACAEHVGAMAAALTAAQGGIAPKRVKL